MENENLEKSGSRDWTRDKKKTRLRHFTFGDFAVGAACGGKREDGAIATYATTYIYYHLLPFNTGCMY